MNGEPLTAAEVQLFAGINTEVLRSYLAIARHTLREAGDSRAAIITLFDRLLVSSHDRTSLASVLAMVLIKLLEVTDASTTVDRGGSDRPA